MFMPGVWILWSKKKIVIIFQKENGNTFTLFIIFIVKSLQKERNSTNLLLWPPICRNKSAIPPKWFNSLETNSNLGTYNYVSTLHTYSKVRNKRSTAFINIGSFSKGYVYWYPHSSRNCTFILKMHIYPKIAQLS